MIRGVAMTVGAVSIKFVIHGCNSLKEKRSIVKRLIARVQNEYKVSVAETGYQDVHQTGEISAAVVSSDKSYLNSILDKIIDFVEDLHLVEITDSEIEIYR